MIKTAYFRGLTKVAGGYSGWNPTTWSARKNPLSPMINPAVDAVYSVTPAGRAQKKLLQGGQLTAAQDRAMQRANNWGNVIPAGFAAGNLAFRKLPQVTAEKVKQAGRALGGMAHVYNGGAEADFALQTNTEPTPAAEAFLRKYKHGVTTFDAISDLQHTPARAVQRIKHNSAVVDEYVAAMEAAQKVEDPGERQQRMNQAQLKMSRQLRPVYSELGAGFPYALNYPLQAFRHKFRGPQMPKTTRQAYNLAGYLFTPTYADMTNRKSLDDIQQINQTLAYLAELQQRRGQFINIWRPPEEFNHRAYITLASPGKAAVLSALNGGVPSDQLNAQRNKARADAAYSAAQSVFTKANESFPWFELGFPLNVQQAPKGMEPYQNANIVRSFLARRGLGPVPEQVERAGNNIARAFLPTLFPGWGPSAGVTTALANWQLDPSNDAYRKKLREDTENTSDYLKKALGLTPTINSAK